MAPLPVIANTFRCGILWNRSDPAVSLPFNVFHVRCTTSSNLQAIATAIGTAWNTGTTGGQIACMPTALSFQALQITPLDGSTAAQDLNVGHAFGGSSTGQYIPNQAGLVSFKTAQRGSRGRGRLYLGPIGEDVVNDGALASATKAAMLADWGTMIANLVSGSPSMHLVVASYKHADAHDVTSHRIDSIVGSQRRRLNQLR